MGNSEYRNTHRKKQHATNTISLQEKREKKIDTEIVLGYTTKIKQKNAKPRINFISSKIVGSKTRTSQTVRFQITATLQSKILSTEIPRTKLPTL